MSRPSADSASQTIAIGDLTGRVGTSFGPGAWRTIDQSAIDAFAAITGDRHWIHTDPERAARELPGGRTLVHGYLTLSLLTGMIAELVTVPCRTALNYGLDRVRFVTPIPAGGRVRLSVTLAAATPVADGGVKLETDCTLELEGAARPAMVARSIAIYYG